MTTIKDIARSTGFSINTVSNALQNKDNVKKETKECIQKAAKDLNYIPSAIARSLVSKKTYLIALVIHSIEDPFYTELINHIEKFVYANNYKLVLFNHNEDIERQNMILDSIAEQAIDGIIINPALSDGSAIKKITRYNIPFVLLVRNYEEFSINFIGIDFKLGLRLVVNHFLKYDRKHILNICGSSVTQSSKTRLLGYKNALDANNIEYDPELVINRIDNEKHLWKQIDDLIKEKKSIDAIYCYDFYTTSMVLKYCKLNNINIPEDIALIGFEYDKFCENAYIPVTAIKYDLYGISENSWSVLKKLIESKNSSKMIQNTYTKPELIIRKSCGE